MPTQKSDEELNEIQSYILDNDEVLRYWAFENPAHFDRITRLAESYSNKKALEARKDELEKAYDTRLWNDGMGIYLSEGMSQLSNELKGMK